MTHNVLYVSLNCPSQTQRRTSFLSVTVLPMQARTQFGEAELDLQATRGSCMVIGRRPRFSGSISGIVLQSVQPVDAGV